MFIQKARLVPEAVRDCDVVLLFSSRNTFSTGARIFLVMVNGLPCSRPVRIQLIWKKNRDLLAHSIQVFPNDTDFRYSLNSNKVRELDEIRAANTVESLAQSSIIIELTGRSNYAGIHLKELKKK